MAVKTSRRWLAGSLVALVAVVSGCSNQAVQIAEDSSRREVIINPERSERGNPPVYEVFGERYFVLETSAGYLDRGIASWYGEDFHGKTTSGGESYDMYALTAAHKSLPIPTWVEVTHLGNGKRVIVKVNDRGPFVEGRIIDLSYTAAEAIGMLRVGTAMVEVRALGEPAGQPILSAQANTDIETSPGLSAGLPPEPEPPGFSIISAAAAATPTDADRPLQRIYAQVGAFSQHDNALRLVGRLQEDGYDPVFVVTERRAVGDLHRVRIGPLATLTDYDNLVYDLSAIGMTDSRLIVER
jgi:rare lipoprotein A